MSNIARRSEEWHLNRDWMVLVVAALILIAVKLGLAVPWNNAVPAAIQTGAQFAPNVALGGLLVGFLVGLTGMGSGSLMAPVMIFLLHVQPTTAVGTDLVYASVTKAFGAFQHYKQKHVDVTLTRWLATGSIPGALLGAQAIAWMQHAYGDSVQSNILRIMGVTFVLVSASIAAKLFLKPHVVPTGTSGLSAGRKAFSVVIGFVAGILVGLTSVGGGSIVAVLLMLFFPLTASTLVGTDVFHALLLTTVAGASHLLEGNVNLALVANLLIGSIPGIVLGSQLVSKVPDRAVRVVLSIVLLLTGIKMWMS